MIKRVDDSMVELKDLIEKYQVKARKAKSSKEFRVYSEVIIDLRLVIDRLKEK